MSLENKIVTLAETIGADVRKLKNGKTFSPPVHELEYPIIISHRGGATIYPEQSMLGFKKSMLDGYYPEMDIVELADGELLLAHDTTANRTMRGVKGSFSSLTREEVEMGYLINAQTKCVLSQKPVFFEDLLDKLGGKIVLFPEIKNVAVGSTQRIIQAVKERGLEDWVVIQSFNYDDCKAVAEAGLHSLFLSSGYPSQSPVKIFSDGIRFVGGTNANYSQVQVTNLKNAGLKVIAYTVNSKNELNEWLSKGGDGVFSDDPWYIDDNIEIVSSVDFKTGRGLSGIYVQSLDSSESSKNKIVALEDNTFFNQSGLFAYNDYAMTRNKVFYLPQLQRVSPPFRIRVVMRHQIDNFDDRVAAGGLMLFRPQSERDFINDFTQNRDFISAVNYMTTWKSKSGIINPIIQWSLKNKPVSYPTDSIDQEMVLDVTDNELTLLNRTTGGYEKVQDDFSSYTDLLIGVRCNSNTVFKEIEVLDTETPLTPIYAGLTDRLEKVDGGYIRYSADGTFEAFRRYSTIPSTGANVTLTTEWDLSDTPITRESESIVQVTVLTPSPETYNMCSADIVGKKLYAFTRRTTTSPHHFCIYYKGFWR